MAFELRPLNWYLSRMETPDQLPELFLIQMALNARIGASTGAERIVCLQSEAVSTSQINLLGRQGRERRSK